MNDNYPIPQDYHSLYPWFGLIRSMRSVGKSGGVSILTIRVVVDEMGKPILFGTPAQTRLHPRENAREVINLLLGELTE